MEVLLHSDPEPDNLVQNLLRFAYKARREGVVSLDSELEKIRDPFLKESLMLAIDLKADDLRKMMEVQLDYEDEKDEKIPKVFEAAGGFAPTIGILGAVLGLIQVMQRLQDLNAVGKGIAVAFVATIYGVGIGQSPLLAGGEAQDSAARKAGDSRDDPRGSVIHH